MYNPKPDEIRRRIERRGKPIRFTRQWGVETYSLIPLWQSRNNDGSHAGYRKKSDEGDRVILQKSCTNHNNAKIYYTNWW